MIDSTRLAAIKALRPTPGPWQPCTHLRERDDCACPCGYRGGIWSGDGESIVCEMGGSPEQDGTKIVPERPRVAQFEDADFIVAAADPEYGLQALAAEVERLQERENPVKPVLKKRILKAGYGYCICAAAACSPFIVSSDQNYCPNCGRKLEWS